MGFVERILAELPNRPNRPDRPDWIWKAERKQKQEPEKINKVPEGTFDQMSPSQIAQDIKTKSDSFDQAISRVQYYINRSGERLTEADKHKMDRVKEALYRSYGRELPKNSYGS